MKGCIGTVVRSAAGSTEEMPAWALAIPAKGLDAFIVFEKYLVPVPFLDNGDPAYSIIGANSPFVMKVRTHAGSPRHITSIKKMTVLAVCPHQSDYRRDTILVKAWGWHSDLEFQRWELEPAN